jgi:translation elongation factor EF-Ts
MAEKISAKLVKDLRDKTNAGMMDCKKSPQRKWWRHHQGNGMAAQKRNYLCRKKSR